MDRSSRALMESGKVEEGFPCHFEGAKRLRNHRAMQSEASDLHEDSFHNLKEKHLKSRKLIFERAARLGAS